MGTKIPLNVTANALNEKFCSMQLCDKSLAGIPQLLADLQKLSEDQESADVIFLLDKDEERVYAHKIILMARCKSFQTTKRGEFCRIPGSSVSSTAPGTPVQIRLPHVNANIFRQFILYAYTGKVIFQDMRIFEMMALAQDLGVDELKMACEDHVVSTLSTANACTFLAAMLDIHQKGSGAKCTASFMQKCILYIGENAAECVKTTAFLNLSKDGIIKLISSDSFCLEEEDVWRCCLAWAKHQAGVTQPTGHWTEEERIRVCQHLSVIMGHIRLLLIDSQVFAEEVEPTGAVPIELSLERYRHAALQPNNNKNTSAFSLPTMVATPAKQSAIPGGPFTENDKRLQPRLLVNMFPGSVILKNEKLHFQGTLNRWYGVPKQSWRLVFRASAHGFSASAFHRHCDGLAPVFVIGLGTRGEVSGGFTDVPWAKTSRKGGYIHSERSFLFSLCTGNEPPAKYDIIKKPYAICYHPEVGPIFGAGADLQISNGCDTNMDSYSNLPHSYDGGTNASCNSLFGDYHFSIVDYEVYTLASSSSSYTPPGNKFKHDRH